jgi:hypothetical protein
MNWDIVDLDQFVKTLGVYKQRFYGGTHLSGEDQYTAIYTRLQGLPIERRTDHIDAIVLFLNQWHCRLSRVHTPPALAAWIRREAPALVRLSGLAIDHADVPAHRHEFNRLHDSLRQLQREGVQTIGNAAISKILHLMIPPLFVMWDNAIRERTVAEYGRFIVDMHQFALRLKTLLAVQSSGEDIESYLQVRLGYPFRKPLAKYIDEYNWYLAYG